MFFRWPYRAKLMKEIDSTGAEGLHAH